MTKEEEINFHAQDFDEQYMNMTQIKANYIDPNVLIAEIGRGGGKTQGIFGPRMIKVGFDMPRETSFLVHKTYVALLSNIVPNIKVYFNTPDKDGRPIMKEGIDYVIGETQLPKHFAEPRIPITNPKQTIVLRTGHNFRLVASDQPDSVAGASGVHAFVEEMKHNTGQKLKSRLFPAMRGAPINIRKSHYYQGITGVSDTARVDLGEDNWFEEYEQYVDTQRINEIASEAHEVNKRLIQIRKLEYLLKECRDMNKRAQLMLNIKKANHFIEVHQPRLARMRKNATYYMRASSFANKDFLGKKFFTDQIQNLSMDEFLVAICAIRIRKAENLFFVNLNARKHFFSDGYRYNNILSYDLRDNFKLSANYLRHFQPREQLLLGYDPGYFQSLVVGQENKENNELRILKDFHVWGEKDQADLARDMYEYFGAYHENKEILLYYDRAGNKSKQVDNQITSDAQILAKELRAYGFRVRLMNEKQRTIYYYEHYKLLGIILGEKLKHTIRLKICENECKNLKSSLFVTAVKKDDGKVLMDKSAEKKLPWNIQASLSPQLASSLTYLLFSRYHNQLPNEMSTVPDVPSTMTM